MSKMIKLASLFLAGVAIVGCTKKDDTANKPIDKNAVLKDNGKTLSTTLPTTQSMMDKATDMKDKAMDKATDMKDKAVDKATDMKDKAMDGMTDMKNKMTPTTAPTVPGV